MRHRLIILWLIALLSPAATRAQLQVKDLRCEYLSNPIGIDQPHPRLTWSLPAPFPATSGELKVFAHDTLIWTAPLTDSTSRLVRYEGPDLQPFTRYKWTITYTDTHRDKHIGTAFFETGMMAPSNWKGNWISDSHDKNFPPAPYFRKVVPLRKPVKKATVYIAAAGLYELSVNGEKVDSTACLEPLYTRFDRRNLYVSYDVTSLGKGNRMAIGVILGNGWYNMQSTAVWNFDKASWRNRPAFLLNLRVEYKDGTIETFATGPDWKTATGEISFNSIYTGEHQDRRRYQKGWDLPSFNDSQWQPAIVRESPAPLLVSQAAAPVRRIETLPAKTMRQLSDTCWVFDLGRNIAGISQLTADGPAGTVIRLKHSEQLNASGHADQSNIDVHYRPVGDGDPFQTDIYILDGKGPHTFSPLFNYKGFQYVEVTASRPLKLSATSLSGIVLHSAVPKAGQLTTSNPLMNKIWEATNSSYLANLFGYPTDCPQREKNGWTGDAHINVETGLYNFDGITIYEKWLADHRDEQQPDGTLPSIIPTAGWGYEWGNGPDWTSTIAIIPWNLYLFYGDTTALADNYNAIKKYVDLLTHKSPEGICNWGLGDWVPVKSVTPMPFTSTVYYYTDVRILAKTAKILGKTADYQHYSHLADFIKNAFNEKYLNKQTGIYDTGLQTEQAVPLYWGLTPDSLKTKVAAALATRVQADSLQPDVGLLGSKAILSALSDNGYGNIAWQLASRETYPGWGWWIKNGATTLFENWKTDAQSDISRNHIMFGEISAWMYKALLGIRPVEDQPGFRQVYIAPVFPAGLDSVNGYHHTPYGDIAVAWRRTGNDIAMELQLPPGSNGTLQLYHQPQEITINHQPVKLSADNRYQNITGKVVIYLKNK
ncbi:alpha-L-rhamnosidase [Chitinophaga sp. Cy-1792]|uniref:alpha-L-rhamnosidase n=1 Tax=Chitinophaga sp. Cy-1792 TaxID=2608339 RepID=UPI001420916D|nr:alpha-L-rhamnosidase [Chitinophaga sp. Cy-1792]NIG54154.1 Bacterial alpha-L-rhamnosidase [Chitinophaga sp. Cy-1792]